MAKLKIDPMAILMNSKERDRFYAKLDEHQRNYHTAILSKSVVCCNEKSGTGKTSVAVLAGLQMLAEGKVSKISYIRIPDDRSLKLGYLPGDLEAKCEYYFYPFYDACIECGLQIEAVDELIEQGMIELTTDLGMRGRNLKKSFVIIDECQSSNLSDLKLILTRLLDDCICVMLGHSGQFDNFCVSDRAFERYIEHMCKKPWAVKCDLPINYRGKISRHADELY